MVTPFNTGAAAINFFGNLRTPAALIAAAAIKDAFVMQSAPEDIKKSRGWRLLRNLYLLLQMTAFSSELSCVFIATHAITQLQMTNMNVLAPTLGEMLFRELEYEYVGVRTGFTTGLLAFTLAQALRVRLALRRSKELSWCAMWFLISAACSLLAYNNANSINYGGFIGLTARWSQLHAKLMISRLGLANPVVIASLVSLAMSLAIAVQITLKTISVQVDEMDTNGDGVIGPKEMRVAARRWWRCVGRLRGDYEYAEDLRPPESPNLS